MKIKVEPKDKCNGIICLQKDCPWDDVCANHTSAGDYRSEGGSRPLLKLMNGELHCDTFHSPGNGYKPHEEPVNVDYCLTVDKWNMFLWSQLVEQVNNFQI